MTYRVCAGPCGKRRQEKFFNGARGRVCMACQKATRREAARKAHLAKTYGLVVAEYNALLDFQDGACAICHGERPYNLAVDHSHADAELFGIRASVRGLLCKRCNRILRDARDSTALLHAAASYLESPPAPTILKGVNQ